MRDGGDRADGGSVSEASLFHALDEARGLGFLGDRRLLDVVEHARLFGFALGVVLGEGTAYEVVDLGAGGGVPGLVLAHDFPTWRLTLVDRRAKRTDFLQRVVTRLGWRERVTVRCADVADVIRESPHQFDAAVARGFGPPMVTLVAARSLVRDGGRIVISEPPAGDRWDAGELERLAVRRGEMTSAAGRVATFDTVEASGATAPESP